MFKTFKTTLASLLVITAMSSAYAAGPNALTTVTTTAAGQSILADTFGRTLYVFDVDGKDKSNCSGACIEIWPPYLISEAEEALVKAPFGKIQRASNEVQLTLDGRPVYTYMLDRKVGDILGDGLGNVWHVIPQ